MSVNISIHKINKREADQMLESILDGSFQDAADQRISTASTELEKYPKLTREEIYGPESENIYWPRYIHTPEIEEEMIRSQMKRQEIIDGLKEFRDISTDIQYLNEARKKQRAEEFDEWLNALVGDIISANSESFFSSLWDVQVYTDILFKYSEPKPEDPHALEKISFETWRSIFSNLNREILTAVKNDIENDREKSSNTTFDEFAEIIITIRNLQKGCDGVNYLFSVEVEGEKSDQTYENTIKGRILKHLESAPLRTIKSIDTLISAR